MIAGLERCHAFADFHTDARALMAKNGGKAPFGIFARQGESIGVADAGRPKLDQHFAVPRPVEVDVGDFERLARLERDGKLFTRMSKLRVEWAIPVASNTRK